MDRRQAAGKLQAEHETVVVTQGFDPSVAETKSGWPGSYFYPWPEVKNMAGKKGDYLTDRLTDEVIRSLEQPHDRPSFIHLSFFHLTVQPRPEKNSSGKYEAKLSPEHVQRNPTNAGMIQILDENVGRIMQSLDDLKLADDTLLIFASDNGGVHYADRPQKTNNAPLRDGKGSAMKAPIVCLSFSGGPGISRQESVTDVLESYHSS